MELHIFTAKHEMFFPAGITKLLLPIFMEHGQSVGDNLSPKFLVTTDFILELQILRTSMFGQTNRLIGDLIDMVWPYIGKFIYFVDFKISEAQFKYVFKAVELFSSGFSLSDARFLMEVVAEFIYNLEVKRNDQKYL